MSWSRVNERERKRRCLRGDEKGDAFIFTLSEIQVLKREVTWCDLELNNVSDCCIENRPKQSKGRSKKKISQELRDRGKRWWLGGERWWLSYSENILKAGPLGLADKRTRGKSRRPLRVWAWTQRTWSCSERGGLLLCSWPWISQFFWEAVWQPES